MATIQSMDQIYGGATLTIVAASRINASYRLSGARGTTAARKQQCSLTLGSYNFLVSNDTESEIKALKWNSRGWTYQEALLSRRNLVFTNSQVYFRCRQALWLEGLTRQLGYVPLGSQTNSVAIYMRLQEYFPRDLSRRSDTVAAFEGILHAFGNDYPGGDVRNTHLFDIPMFYLDIQDVDVSTELATMKYSFLKGLDWYPEPPDADTKHTSSQQEETTIFPSWTWAYRKTGHSKSSRGLEIWYCLRSLDALTLQNDVTVQLTYVNGGLLDLGTQSRSFNSSSHFEPWKDLKLGLSRSTLGSIPTAHPYELPTALPCQWPQNRRPTHRR